MSTKTSCLLTGFGPKFFMFPIGPLRFDPCSLVLILLLSALLAYGTEASNMFNIGKPSYLCFRLCNSTPTKSTTGSTI